MDKRLFVALMLESALSERVHEGVRVALGDAVAGRGRRSPLRLLPVGGLHLTLFFLGDFDNRRVPGLVDALGPGLDGLRAPRLALDRAGAFPARGRERVLWIGLREVEKGGLAGLRDRVLAAVERFGLETEAERARAFAPHLTVARIVRGAGVPRTLVPDLFYALELEGLWTPREVCLVESVFPSTPGQAPLYVPLARFPFGGV